MSFPALIVVAVVAVGFLGYVIAIYNGFVRLRNNIDKSWANIDVLLKQRHEEIPNLLKVCEGYLTHGRGVIGKVLQARAALMGARGNPAEAGRLEGALEALLKQLFAIAGNYPDLKAQASFQQIQGRISALDNQIADRRGYYNECVNRFNIRIESFPGSIIAGSMDLQEREFFRVYESDKTPPEIEFKFGKS
ncbi:MAG: LemA family protein [Deltaproteobacteria bacterium]|nr:LemA family protein [Deltaproteobacteria bacterium]